MAEYVPGRIVVDGDAPRDEWLEGRSEGVTASEVLKIARGGRSTWAKILEQKMNGSTFKGNRYTRAGSEREAALVDAAAELVERSYGGNVEPNSALWAAAENDRYRATPDGIGSSVHGELIVEVKSHAHGWSETGIPDEHFAQMQWQMLVMGARWGVYVFEVRDEEDQPQLEGPHMREVHRDDEYIAWLKYRADAFLAWRDAGCPEYDELDEATEAAITEWLDAKEAASAAAAREKKAAAVVKGIANRQPFAHDYGTTLAGKRGGVQLSVSWRDEVDTAEWEAAMPEEAAAYARYKMLADDYLSEALELGYRKTKRVERLLQAKAVTL